MIFGAHTLRAKHDVTAMELGPAWRRLGIGGVRRERYSCSSSVADPRSQNAAARSQTAIPALVAPCAQLSVGLEQLTTGRRVLACALIAGRATEARTIVATATAVAQRVDEQTLLVTVLDDDDDASATRRLDELCAQARPPRQPSVSVSGR
jgi:hypothetical protein